MISSLAKAVKKLVGVFCFRWLGRRPVRPFPLARGVRQYRLAEEIARQFHAELDADNFRERQIREWEQTQR